MRQTMLNDVSGLEEQSPAKPLYSHRLTFQEAMKFLLYRTVLADCTWSRIYGSQDRRRYDHRFFEPSSTHAFSSIP
ncbi:unnamed protein product [Haemonchus placei]|uniref:Uncharacterized protein n=1 Tax=Haemonchus placei TaxID=6290 RepID=A0A3P8BSJ2_HAEPC|nr:unnamed protein product [Haemonchus placei]